MGDIPFTDLPFDDDDGAPELVRPALESGDSAAIALALGLAAHDPKVAAEAAAFLRAQTELVNEQRDKLREEDPMIPAALREGRLRRLIMWFRATLLLFVAFGVAVFVALGTVMLRSAFSHRVVVEAFQAPPDMEPRGISGRTVASGVLDALSRLRDATRSSFTPLAAQSAWARDVQVEVPETGVSIGEIDRLLHQMLGRDIHITGELVETDHGLALTVRGDGVPAKTFSGGRDDLAKLTEQAAEWVYGRSQPHEYAVYLSDRGRDADALAFLPGAFARAADDDGRAELANAWGVAFDDLNEMPQAAEKWRLAMSLKPYFWKAWGNLVGVLAAAEGEESAWRESRALLKAAATAPPSHRPEERLLSNAMQLTFDNPRYVAAMLQEARETSGGGTGSAALAPEIAAGYAAMHDWGRAARWMTGSDPADPFAKAEGLYESGERAMEQGRPQDAIAPLETFRAAWAGNPAVQGNYLDFCLLGLAYGLSGRAADAEAVFKANGHWNECYAWHGDVLAHAGDVAGANRAWAEGIRIGPDLPVVFLHRGMWRAAHGDAAGAAADFAAANARAPHFADPLKAWGDLLAAEGKRGEAKAKYDAARRYAPDWAALREAGSG